MAQYGFAIDLKRCIGCHTCVVTCKNENNVPNGIWWNRVLFQGGKYMDTPDAEFPNGNITYIPVACQHCENPACVKVCPVGATYKDAQTGAVRQDFDKCIGCRMCMAACPFTGVRSFNWEDPTYYNEAKLGHKDAPDHQKHTVEKCTMCWHRIAKGENPACIAGCTMHARTFGDIDDPTSEISQKIAGRQYKQLLAEKGTRPSVFYLL